MINKQSRALAKLDNQMHLLIPPLRDHFRCLYMIEDWYQFRYRITRYNCSVGADAVLLCSRFRRG